MSFFCRLFIRARMFGTKRCSEPVAPSIPLVISSLPSTCSATGFRPPRAIRHLRKTVPGSRALRSSTTLLVSNRLLTKHLGVRRIALIVGWSMAGMQAYQWAAQYPEMVEAILPYCASARCSPINHAFLDGPKAALQADAAWCEGEYGTPPERGLRAFGRVYVAWAYSAKFFRDGLYRQLGFDSVEGLVRDWELDHLRWDANDLLAKIWTWQNADISDNAIYRGDFDRRVASHPRPGDRDAVQHRHVFRAERERGGGRTNAACGTACV